MDEWSRPGAGSLQICRNNANSLTSSPRSRALILLAAAAALVCVGAVAASGKKRKHRGGGGVLIASDTAANPNPDSFWGRNYCANDSRVQQITSGGDTHPTATGAPAGQLGLPPFDRLRGDNSFGERCELGWEICNSPTAFYRRGKHRITEISIRLPSKFPLSAFTWQAVTQMKSARPYNNTTGTPVLELDAYGGAGVSGRACRVSARDSRSSGPLRRRPNFWTRFMFNIRYSTAEKRGDIRVGVDLNGDGDFADPGELQSKAFTPTPSRSRRPVLSPDIAVGHRDPVSPPCGPVPQLLDPLPRLRAAAPSTSTTCRFFAP